MTYAVIKNGQQVYKGTADKNGFTQAFNGDYLDHWESQAFGH
jgi:hypothetical protein